MKTKVLITGRDIHTLQTFGKYSCAVCRKGAGKNSIFFSSLVDVHFGFTKSVLIFQVD